MRFYKPNKGVSLPTLTKPASPADIVLGKEAINGNGMKITGTLEVTGGEPSYTLQIKTENYSDGTDSIIYYAPGDSMKSTLNLTTSYQSFTCGDFICIKRGSIDNVMSGMILYNDADSHLLMIGPGTPNLKYAIDLKANGGYATLNIRAIMRDFPAVAKISLNYMQS